MQIKHIVLKLLSTEFAFSCMDLRNTPWFEVILHNKKQGETGNHLLIELITGVPKMT